MCPKIYIITKYCVVINIELLSYLNWLDFCKLNELCVDLGLLKSISSSTLKLGERMQLDQKSIYLKYLVTFSRRIYTLTHSHMHARIPCRVRAQSSTTRNLFRAHVAQFATNSPRRACLEIYPLSNKISGINQMTKIFKR